VRHLAATAALRDMWVVCSDRLILEHFQLRVQALQLRLWTRPPRYQPHLYRTYGIGYTCNGTTAPLGLDEPSYQHSVPSASSQIYCQLNALRVGSVRLCLRLPVSLPDAQIKQQRYIHLPVLRFATPISRVGGGSRESEYLKVSDPSLNITSSPHFVNM
jgi:hypothetical protein